MLLFVVLVINAVQFVEIDVSFILLAFKIETNKGMGRVTTVRQLMRNMEKNREME